MGLGIRIGLMSLLMALALCFSSSAIAQTPAPGNTSTTNVSSKAQSIKTCQAYAGLTNRIASCVRDALQKAGSRYFDPRTGVYSYVARAITALFTLAVAIYGAMAAAGMIERPARDTFMLMIKIAMVAFFTTNVDVAYRQVIAMMDATGQAVVSFVPADGMVANSEEPPSECMKRMIEANGTSRLAGPWLGLDCVVDTVIGIKLGDSQATGSAIANLSGGGYTSGSNEEDDKKASKARADTINNYYNDKLKSNEQGQSRGLINFLFSSLKTSVLGFMIAIIGFIFIYGLVMLLVKSLLIYMAGYIGITVMMIIAPIFIPLVLFKQTKEYFDKWVRMLMGFALQPIIILINVTSICCW
jgi:hypothetical protein